MEVQNEHFSEHSFDSTASEGTAVLQRTLPKPPTSSLWTRLLQTLLPHEWLLGFAVMVAMYLVNGTYAHSVCAICTSLPAVIHSYRVITEEKDNLVAHQVALCYWILLGSMSVLDVVLGNAFCYYFAKFILMSAVYAHVVSKSRSQKDVVVQAPVTANTLTEQLFASTEITAPTQAHSVMSPQQLSGKSLVSTNLSSAAPLTSKNSSLANYLQWTKNNPASPSYVPTQSQTTQFETATPTEFSVHESEHLIKKPGVAPAGDAPTLYCETFPDVTSTFGELPLSPNSPVTDFNEASRNSATDAFSYLRHRHAPHHQSNATTSAGTTDWSRTFTPMQLPNRRSSPLDQALGVKSLPSNASMISLMKNSSVETFSTFENDLATDPSHTITFVAPFNDIVPLTVTNVTTNRIMYALKTNAIDRVIASPTCGFLTPGGTIHVKMAIRNKADITNAAVVAHDRMAIDYAFVHDSCVHFDPACLVGRNSGTRRKSFDINYVF